MEKERSMTIHKLPSEVQSVLRSGVVITSMAQCVDELVFNAIDAGATSIAIRVNFKFHKIQVVDNGCGMNSTHLDLIGTRYMTSKCHSLEDLSSHLDQFGFRGEALASLREVSGLLTLESRPKGSDITYCKVFTHGKSHKAGVSKTIRPGQGTTITVHDFMYNMPVRRRRIRSAIDLEEIKSHIECIAVMQPQISFSLRNDTNGSLILHTRKCADIISAFSCLFGQTVAQSLVAVSSSLDEFKVTGYISKEVHHQKTLQFVYVNKRLVLKSKLHKLANSMLGNSFILKTNATSRDIPISKEISVGRWLAFFPPRKRDKYAVYLLNVECPYHLYDICIDPKKTLIEFCDWDKVLQCMESAIRTFLEKEYPMHSSHGSSVYSLKEKSSGVNIPPLLKEMDQVEKGHAVRQLKARHVEPTKVLNQEEKSDTYDLSETVTEKMLNVSRAVFGMPAKRREKNEDPCYEDDLCHQSRTLTFEKIEVESGITVVLNSGANRSNNNVLTDFVSNPTLDECESENPFPKSETYIVTQQSITPLTDVLKSNATDITGRSSVNSMKSLSEIPIIEPDYEKSSAQSWLTKQDSDLCPIERFRNFISHRIHPKYRLKHIDLPPITKFRETLHSVSNIEISMPLKKFEQDALWQYLSTSELKTKGINTINKYDKHNKDVTVHDNETADRSLYKCKDAYSTFPPKIPTYLKFLLQEISKKHVDVSNVCKKIYSKGHDDHKLYVDHSVQCSSVQDASRTLSNKSIVKPVIEYESTECTEACAFKLEGNVTHCCTSFPGQSLRTKGVSGVCCSSRGFPCNEFSIPDEKIVEVGECVQFQLHNNFHVSGQNQRETSSMSGVPLMRCVKTSHVACNNGRKCVKTSDLAEAEKVKEHLNNLQFNHFTHKTDTHDGKDMFSLIKNSNKVCNQFKIIHPEINVCKCYMKTSSKNNSSSRNFCTSSDFLHTLERERGKESEYTTQHRTHNVQACNKSVRFNSIDKRVFNNTLHSNFGDSTVQLFCTPSISDCVLQNVSIAEECVRPGLGAVTFRFSPKIVMRDQSSCRNILKILSSNSSVVCNDKLTKNMQHSEYMKNIVNKCTKRTSQVLLTSDCAVSGQRLGNSMILSSGYEADVESSTGTEPCSKKRRCVNKTLAENKRISSCTSNPEDLYVQAQHINSNSEEYFKRKICYSLKKCENWKLNILSKEQCGEENCTSFQGQEKTVEYLPSDRQGNKSRVVGKSSQMAIDERGSQITVGSNDTIVPSSGSCYNSSLSCLHQTASCKMIVSDSGSDLSSHNCIVVSSQDPGNLPCVQKSLIVSSNGKETEREEHSLHETEEGNMIAGTGDIFIPFRQKDSSEAGTRTVGIAKSNLCEETLSGNLCCEKVCTESSHTALSDVISTLRTVYLPHSQSNEDKAGAVGNENSISEGENVNSCEKCNVPQKMLSPNVTRVQNVLQTCNSRMNNETDKVDAASKNNSGNMSGKKQHSIFNKWALPTETIKCGKSSSYKCREVKDSQLPIMENISSGQGQLLSFKGLSPRNTEHRGVSEIHNYTDGETTHMLTRQEVPSVGRIGYAQELSSFFNDSLSRNTKFCGSSDTCSLVKKSSVRDTMSDTESVRNGLDYSLLNDMSPVGNSVHHAVSDANNFTEDESIHTLREDNILNSESNACTQRYGAFFESTQNINKDASESTINININDRKNENYVLNTDFITCGQVTHINTTDSKAECTVLSKYPQTGKNKKVNELLQPVACTLTAGQKVGENQSNLSDRKRRNEVDCLDMYGKRNCTEKQTVNVSTAACNVIVSDVHMSNSISTQDLNEAFDSIMNKIAESDTNKQKNHASITGQNDAHVLGNGTAEVETCEISHITHITEDTDLKCPEGWEQRLDPGGKIFFVHVGSGLTSYTVPNNLMAQNLYSMSKRFAFLPKGMSPILKNGPNKSFKESEEKTLTPVSHQALCSMITDSCSLVDELATVKWKDLQEPKATDCRDLVKRLLAESDSRMQFCEKEVPNACTEELPRSIVKVYNIIYPYTFSKDIFLNLKVLGQLDNKFIVTLVGPKSGKNQNLIVLFDQHAVHERIRLENLMKDYLVEGSDSEFRRTDVNPHINLQLSNKEVRILLCFQKDFEKLGLKFEVMDDTSIQVTSVPTCLLAREQREMHGRGLSVLNGFLESMIREQVDSILTTRGVGIRLPAILQSVISSEACRGAVKFGDSLYPEECEVLLKNLSECQVPFQCAHGRPVLVPIVDLQHLHVQPAQVQPKPQLWKLKERLGKSSHIGRNES